MLVPVDSGVSEIERLTRVALNHRLQTHNLESLSKSEKIEKIRGLLNKTIYTSAENWMMPLWVNLRGSVDTDEQELQNSSNRNHVVIGMPCGRKFACCDESGLLQSIPDCGSIEFWPSDGDKIIFPALVSKDGPGLSLISSNDQIYEWTSSIGSIDFSRLIYHAEHNTSEFILNEIHVKNRTLKPINFTFYVAVRPMSFLGVEPIESITYDDKLGKLYVNGFLTLIHQIKPTAVFLSTADDPNLLRLIKSEKNRCDQNYSTIRGLATAILRYDLTLGPAETQEFYFSNPLDKITQNDDSTSISPNSSYRFKTIQTWFSFSRETMSLGLQDKNLQTAYSQAKAALAIQARSSFSSLPKSSESAFWREQVRTLLALLKIGRSDLVKEIITRYIEDDERVDNQYEFTVISPLIWIATQYITYSKNFEYLKQQSPFLNQWFETILESLTNLFIDVEKKDLGTSPEPEIEMEMDDQAGKESEGSIESGTVTSDSQLSEEGELSPDSEEEMDNEPAPPQHTEEPDTQEVDISSREIIWTSEEFLRLLWNYETVRRLAQILEKGDKIIIFDVLKKCELLILEKLEASSFEPIEYLDILSSFTLLDIVNFAKDQLDDVLLKISNTLLKDELLTISPMKKLVSSHHALRVGHYYCLINQRYMVESILNKVVEFLSKFHFLPEFVNLKTKGGSAGDGCSIHAAADMIHLLRDAMVHEFGSDLILLSGIPEEWYSSTTPIIASAVPTKLGEVQIEIGTSANQHQIELNMKSLPQEIEVHIPHSFSMPMVKVFGAGIANRDTTSQSPNIRVVPLSETVMLTAHK
jgi:hypothetical protein